MLPAGWTSRKEEPVRIPPHDEPEPDGAIVRGSDADYRHRLPEATDVGLLVEIAAKTVIPDRRQANLYGRSGIPVYWIVNLVDRQVEVYTALARRLCNPARLHARPADSRRHRRPAMRPYRRRRHPALSRYFRPPLVIAAGSC